MKINKKVLSFATIIALALTACESYEGRITVEATKKNKSVEETVEVTVEETNAFEEYSQPEYAIDIYNEFLKECGIQLDEVDIEYFASLSSNPDIVTFKTKYGILDYYDINNCAIITDDNYFRLSYISNGEVYYNNLLDLNFSTGERIEEVENMIPATRFIEANGIEIAGYTLLQDKNVPSDDAYAEITKIYGEKVGMCVKMLGLPTAYYDAESFYEAKDNVLPDVKELTY